MFADSLIALSVAATFGLQMAITLVLVPVAMHARGMLAHAFLRELLPRLYLLGVCVSSLATLLLVWRDGRPTLIVSCMLFVALGHGFARHLLRLRSILAQAQEEPQTVLKPIQFLGSAQLAVAMVCVIVNT